jgi:inner membrane protein YidH
VAAPRAEPTSYPWIQTRLALERTLLAWLRTAAALIGFGFAIFQFYEMLDTMPGVKPARHPGVSRIFGITLVGIGTFALALALTQYVLMVRSLGAPPDPVVSGIPRFHPGRTVAIVLMAVGAVTFWVLFTRLPS